MLRDPAQYPLPAFHPSLASFLLPEKISEEQSTETQPSDSHDRPTQDIGTNELSGTLETTGESITTEPTKNHVITESESSDDYDSLFVDNLEEAYNVPTFPVFFGHPDLYEDYEMGDPIDNHPSVHHMFEPYLPEGHPNIDILMARGFILPSYHPDIRIVVEQRSLATSPASLLSYAIAFGTLLILIIHNVNHLKNRTEKIPPPPQSLTMDQSFEATLGSYESEHVNECPITDADESDHAAIEVEHRFVGVLPSLDRFRHNAEELNQTHHDDSLGQIEEVHGSILAYKEKNTTMFRSQWNRAVNKRVNKSNISTGEMINCLLYLLINLAALFASQSYSYSIGLGSLTAGNTLFLVITA